MTRVGRSRARHTAIAAAAMCASLCLAAAASHPAPAAEPSNYFFIKVKSHGSFTADYGDDRLSSDTRGFGTDGREQISWNWEVQAVGRPAPSRNLDFKSAAGASMFRSVAIHESNLVEYDHLGGPSGGALREFPACEGGPYANKRRTIDEQDDSVPRPRELERGEWVADGSVKLANDGGLRVLGTGSATEVHECFGHADMHGLLFDYIHPGDAELPPQDFDPTTDDGISRTFRDAIGLPPEHDGIAPAYHTAAGSSTLTLLVSRVSRDTFKRLRSEYGEAGQSGLANCTPADPNC